MANMYVNDGGSNTSPYDTWAKAATKLSTALAAQAAGEIVYVASNHVETEGADYTPDAVNGTPASPVRIISVQENTTTFETMQTGGGSISAGTYYLTLDGSVVCIGCKFIAARMHFNDADEDTVLDRCRIELTSPASLLGSLGDQRVIWRNVDLVLKGTYIYLYVNPITFIWKGGSLILDGGSVDSGLFRSTGRGGNVIVEDIDLSDYTADKALIHTPGNLCHNYLFKRCKLAATTDVISSAITGGAPIIKVHSCSSSDVIYQLEEHYFEGAIYSDTGIYLNATYDGSNGYSTKMVTNTNASEYDKPLRFKLADIYVDSIGKTLTVELVLDDATTLNNDDFWIEVEYPDSTIAAFGNIISTIMTNPTDAPAALTSSSVSWTGTGGFSNEQKRKVTADFTGVANEAVGVYTVWACLAKPSTTVYVDPKITVA